MKIYVCDNCGCEVKEKKPDECPLCKKKEVEFIEYEVEKTDKEEEKSSQKYKQAEEALQKYNDGCDPQKAKFSFDE